MGHERAWRRGRENVLRGRLDGRMKELGGEGERNADRTRATGTASGTGAGTGAGTGVVGSTVHTCTRAHAQAHECERARSALDKNEG